MATHVVKQFVATINSGTSVRWQMLQVNPPFNQKLRQDATPKWIVEWQAIPLVVTVNFDDKDNNRKLNAAKAGLIVGLVTIVQENDTSLTHIVQISCVDEGNNIYTPAHFVTTYALYAVFHDIP